jgi:hypothetical protein
VAVVDANAIIQGGQSLTHCADRFVSVSEVISEIRDPTSRHSLNFIPFSVDTLEPSPDALKKGPNNYLLKRSFSFEFEFTYSGSPTVRV